MTPSLIGINSMMTISVAINVALTVLEIASYIIIILCGIKYLKNK